MANEIDWNQLLSTILPAIGTAAMGPSTARRAASQAAQQNYSDYDRAIGSSRVNQNTPFGNISWSRDPSSGQYVQSFQFNKPEQERFNTFQQIAGNRMNAAQSINPRYQPIDWNALGFGSMANAVLGRGYENPTGQRPWAQSPYTSVAGEYLNTRYNPMQAFGGVAQAGGGYQPGGVPQQAPSPSILNAFQSAMGVR